MNYDWLKSEPGPKVLVEAMKLYGTKEVAGDADNPEILAWANELGINYYKDDEIPWCGLFMTIIAHRAGKKVVKDPLKAKSWAEFGTGQPRAMLGDILVFTRDGGGHVGLYAGEDDACYHVLGGNQGDQVKVSRIKKDRCIAIRRCEWSVAQPSNVRVVKLSAAGEISKNEA